MSDFATLVAAYPMAAVIIAAFAIAVIFAACAIFVGGFIQGREISFWPPKIGPLAVNSLVAQSVNTVPQSLEGEWFEEIPKSVGRQYSIAIFRIDENSKQISFDGTNFLNDGTAYCTWRSRLVSVDIDKRQIYYIFDAYLAGELHTGNTGFGVLSLANGSDGTLVPESGYYIEAKVDGSPYSHNMRRLGTVAHDLGIADNCAVREQFFRRVVTAYHENASANTPVNLTTESGALFERAAARGCRLPTR